MTISMEIKASEVQKLRQISGAGFMDCKAALVEAKGDMDQALRILREKGIAKSSKRADRVAAEGLVGTWLSVDNKEGIILELNSETDFVARNQEFGALLKSYIELIRNNPSWNDAKQLPTEQADILSGKVGEKISVHRFARFKAAGAGVVAAYVHFGAKLGVLLQIDADKEGAASEDMIQLGHELALQVVGANPTFVNQQEIPEEVLIREKEIAKKQMEGQKKPPEILEKIALGKLQQFFDVNCLLDQPHVRDSSGKTKIKDLVENAGKRLGLKLNVVRFVRFRVGAD